ncbi:MAG: tRNA pseudouridine(55) synthase TruB [Bdellovibrionales bacterium RIFCSPHIGHO2_01_FULL_40_29]|nr:MAG: tRNA pseudouridine(55) synthase TruB [Bdellovibrionales bacterium RIFCSPHIGHO2_01_FULL_40_29]OFZ34563.1 MAG: tRNA pseudouridine(55) synthase TruB [Bdellovibrionales bacterium RIFCSPHIGHO2_02_FULL_40_15]
MHGLLLINKPVGLTSHDVVARVRRLLGTREVGHSGTLDPLASGLMVLLIGEATKLSQYVTEGNKSYQVGLRLGVTTDTLDITGTVLSEKPVSVSPEKILDVALHLSGELSLPVPIFSAKKIDGKKLYEYARAGEAVEIPQKVMKFWNILALTSEKSFEHEFVLSCSKGSFIRSWVSHLGDILECGATMVSLIRTESHHFHINQSVTLEQLEALAPLERQQRLVPLDQALPLVKRIRIKGQDQALMRNGQISHGLKSQLISQFNPEEDQIIQILPEQKGHVLALVGLEPGQGFRIKRVFNC